MMTKSKYITWLVVSGAFTLVAFLLKPCVCDLGWLNLLLDITAMLGGGVFCSFLASFLIELQNEKQAKAILKRQREYILASIRNDFCEIYRQELKQFSGYLAWIAPCESRFKTDKWSIKKIGEHLIWLIEEINFAKTKEVDDSTIIQRNIKGREYLVKENLVYYKLLHQHLLELSTHFATYLLSEILTEEQIEAIKYFTSDIHDGLLPSPDSCVGAEIILDSKKLIFEKTDSVMALMSIPKDMQINVGYSEVVFESHVNVS